MLALSHQNQIDPTPVNTLVNEFDQPSDHKHSILLVEDSPIIQITLSTLLNAQWGYHVDIAHSGEEAIDLYPNGYDAVIMDIGLPGIDGIQATQYIRQHYPNQHTPIIAHTAHGDDTMKQQCLDAGMDDFLIKGIEHQILKHRIEQRLPHFRHREEHNV